MKMNREEGRIVNASMSIVIDSAYIPFSSMWLNKPMKNLYVLLKILKPWVIQMK